MWCPLDITRDANRGLLAVRQPPRTLCSVQRQSSRAAVVAWHSTILPLKLKERSAAELAGRETDLLNFAALVSYSRSIFHFRSIECLLRVDISAGGLLRVGMNTGGLLGVGMNTGGLLYYAEWRYAVQIWAICNS